MPQALKWASTERFQTTDTEGSLNNLVPVAGIADIQGGFRVGIAMDSDTDPQASCSS